MRTSNWIASLATGSLLLAGPITTFAATADVTTDPATDVTEEELMDVIENSASSPMMDGRGGGGSYMPYPTYGGVQVDASVTKEVTPDFVALNAYCDSGRKDSREAAKLAMEQLFQEIKANVGADGRVRKMGTVSIYPYYSQTGEDTGSFTSNLSIFIRFSKPAATQRVSDFIESKGCSNSWDVRLVDTQDFELSVLDDLSSRLNKRKAVFEKLLGKKLSTINSAVLNTWVDGYSTYDPETNKADATTTLSVSFDLGSRTTIPATRSSTRATPKG